MGREDVCRLLVDAGADAASLDADGHTPAAKAASQARTAWARDREEFLAGMLALYGLWALSRPPSVFHCRAGASCHGCLAV